MRPRSLRGRLLITVIALLAAGSLAVMLAVTRHYSLSLTEAMTAQAEKIAGSLALEIGDRVLLNEIVEIQRLFDRTLQTNPQITYLFVQEGERVLTHTFPAGIPVGLRNLHGTPQGRSLKRIMSSDGRYFLDVASPLFEGGGLTLRVGYSEESYRTRLHRMWFQMGAYSLATMALAALLTWVLVRRLTEPITRLAGAARQVDSGVMTVRVEGKMPEETAVLAAAFNRMVGSIRRYTERLERQNRDLERSHRQSRVLCRIMQEIGSLPSLRQMGPYLIEQFWSILSCRHLSLVLLDDRRELGAVLTARGATPIEDPVLLDEVAGLIHGNDGIKVLEPGPFRPPLIADEHAGKPCQRLFCFDREQVRGALVMSCSGRCRCSIGDRESSMVRAILHHAAGTFRRALRQERRTLGLRARVEADGGFHGMMGKDPKIQSVFQLIEDVAASDTFVLIEGESGTGKELAARAIHELSHRRHEPFVVINCAAYPATLLESELFGHEKGAFTGALRRKRGRFEAADRGTVFLDEIGEIPPSAQIKLLRVLQTRRFERLGGEKTLSVDVRIIAATHRNLLAEIQIGRFREDLFYRLNVIPIAIPPLRERRNDIPLLAHHFLRRLAEQQGKPLEDFSPEAAKVLMEHDWPGNVRELENTIEHAAVLSKGAVIQLCDLPVSLQETARVPVNRAFVSGEFSSSMAEHERNLLERILFECGGNKKKAARQLGISRNTLYLKLKKHGLIQETAH